MMRLQCIHDAKRYSCVYFKQFGRITYYIITALLTPPGIPGLNVNAL